MKKIISVLLVLAVAITGLFAFSSCNKAVAKNGYRWQVGETFTYTISLSGITTVNVGSTTPTEEAIDYVLLNAELTDQVKPLSAIGTYTCTISAVEESPELHRLTTVLELIEKYPSSAFAADNLQALIAQDIATSNTADNTVLVTTAITSTCDFKFESQQLPAISSYKTVKGAYVGKERQAVNDYNVKCEYTYGKKNYCNITFVDNVTAANSFTEKVKIAAATIDNELLMLFVRSYDMASLATAGGAVAVMDPLLTKQAVSVNFKAVASTATSSNDVNAKRYLSSTFAVDSCYSVSATPSASTTSYYNSMVFYFENTAKLSIGAVNMLRNGLVKFQQGYLLYTLNNDGLTSLGYTVEP